MEEGTSGKVSKVRGSKKRNLTKILEEHPELRRALSIRRISGRPRIEEDQLLPLKAILHIGMHGSASHDNRQSDINRTVKTLD